MTPWGDSSLLRQRRLRPGPGTAPEEVARNQRERLFAAMVASVVTRGYAATRVADLVELSGVSSKSFYGLFADKEACFVATVEAVLGTFPSEPRRQADSSWEEDAVNRAVAFAEAIVAQPAAARLCLVEAYAAGPEALAILERAAGEYRSRLARTVAESPERAGFPGEMLDAYVGAVQEVTRTRLREGREEELPATIRALMAFFLSYRPPPQPLRRASRAPGAAPEALEGLDHPERIIRALTTLVTEQGYGSVTVGQIVKRAGISGSMFYTHFDSKEDAMLAAIDSAGAQVMAAVMPAYRRYSDWGQGVAAGLTTFFGFLASHPSLARLLMIDAYAAGPVALARRDTTLRPLESMLGEGARLAPGMPTVAIEAISGGIRHLVHLRLSEEGPQALPALGPVCQYIALAPFLGAEPACRVVNGEARRPTHARDPEAMRAVIRLPHRERVLEALAYGASSAQEIAARLSQPVETVRAHLDALEGTGLIEFVETRRRDGVDEEVYDTNLGAVSLEKWAAMSLGDRQRIAEQITSLMRAELELSQETGAFYVRPEVVLGRTALILDEQGWRELSVIMTEAVTASMEIEIRSRARLAGSGEPGFPARAFVALFEMSDDAEEE